MTKTESRETMSVSIKFGLAEGITLRNVFVSCNFLELYESDNVLEGRGQNAMLVSLTAQEQNILEKTNKVEVEPDHDLDVLPSHNFGFLSPPSLD